MLSGKRADSVLELIADMVDSKIVQIAYHANDPNVGLANAKDLRHYDGAGVYASVSKISFCIIICIFCLSLCEIRRKYFSKTIVFFIIVEYNIVR